MGVLAGLRNDLALCDAIFLGQMRGQELPQDVFTVLALVTGVLDEACLSKASKHRLLN